MAKIQKYLSSFEAEEAVRVGRCNFALKENGKKGVVKTRFVCREEKAKKLEKKFSLLRKNFSTLFLRGFSFFDFDCGANEAEKKIRSVFS